MTLGNGGIGVLTLDVLIHIACNCSRTRTGDPQTTANRGASGGAASAAEKNLGNFPVRRCPKTYKRSPASPPFQRANHCSLRQAWGSDKAESGGTVACAVLETQGEPIDGPRAIALEAEAVLPRPKTAM
jgi:hypothetical protein